MDERRDLDRRTSGAAGSARFEAGRNRGDGSDGGVSRPPGDWEDSREWAVPGNERGDSTRTRRPEEIERDIKRTRAEMTETINEIEERLSPQYLKRQLNESVHETIDSVRERFSPQHLSHKAKGVGFDMIDSIKENPLPAILTGLGLAWWMRNASDQGGNDFRTPYARRYPNSRRGMYGREGIGDESYYGDEYYGYRRPSNRGSMYYDEPGYTGASSYSAETSRAETDYYPPDTGSNRSMGDRASERAGDLRHRATDQAHELQHRASETAHEIGDRANEMAHEARYRMQRAGRQAQYRARRAGSWMDDMMHENPVAAGAIALGIGALVGMALPRTHQEDEWMGEYRDEVVDRAEDVARDYASKAQHVAERATEEIKQSVKDVAGDVTETVKEEAKSQGLTGSSSGSSRSSGSSSGMSSGSAMGGTSGAATTHTTTVTTETSTSGYDGDGASRTTGAGASRPSGLESGTSGIGSSTDRNKGGSNL